LNFDKNNICINCNNFIGIKFKATGIEFNEIPNNGLILHVGFNNSFDNVLYKSYNGIKSNFLNYDDMLKFKIFEQVKTYKTNICYEIMEDKKIIYSYSNTSKNKNPCCTNNDSKEYNIILCYDDSTKFEECHFSISEKTYPIYEIEILINGGLINPLPLNVYKLYLSKMFYIRKNMLIDAMDNSDSVNTATQLLKDKLAKLIKPCYNTNYKITIDKLVKEFPDEKYLIVYLQGLKNCCDLDGKLEFDKYYEFVKLYFFPVLY
jgi:hypothetical protein